MKSQTGLLAVAAAILVSSVLLAVTHRYQYFPKAREDGPGYARVFDTWTGRSAPDYN